MFTTIIDSHPDLTNIEKLQHLRSCLRDTALETIRSLEISDGNYAIALDLLQNRFDNRRLVFQAHITEILGIKAVQSGSVSTLRELSDKFNAHIRALKGLGTTEQIAGCHRPNPVPKIGSGKSGQVGRAFRGPCLRQLNSYLGVNGIISGAAVQDVGDDGFCHGKLCAGHSVSISENPADLDVLTPAHFLNGGPPSSFVEPDVTSLNFNRLDGWQRVAYLQQIFWSRWKEEYLTLLQQRSKWRTPKPGLVVDDLVLVKDENLPPMKWPLARVIELLFGGDGVARVAVLKTASGVTKRAVNKLCLLPLKDDVETQASNGGSMSGHAAAAAN
nr:LOW QUALITY PROTEIN: uncharacterized protein LOC108070124 [Drosophila takahashii]